MEPHSDKSVRGDDVAHNLAFARALDPRPIECDVQAERFMRKLKVNGFLVKGTTDDEFEHLTRTLKIWIAEAINNDRINRILP